jgi:hypothetical protein
MALLDQHSPWNFGQGVAAHWMCMYLTAQQAFGNGAPVLPVEAASWGTIQHSPFTVNRKWS